MKKAIGILHNADGAVTPMKIYFNGIGEPMTAENGDVVENIGYYAMSESDARDAARQIFPVWIWEYEEL